MEKLSLQSLKSLFDFIIDKQTLVFWIRSKDYKRQLYISPSYEKIWMQTTEDLCEHPQSWNDFLYVEDKSHVLSNTTNCSPTGYQNAEGILYFRIYIHQQLKYIRDNYFVLTDEDNQIAGFAGIAQELTAEEWHQGVAHKNSPALRSVQEQLKKQVFTMLKNELNIRTPVQSADGFSLSKHRQFLIKQKSGLSELHLTKRESECLSHLLSGKSAKQTAALMHIESSTAQFHIDNIKEKAQCRTKLEVLSKIVRND